MKLVFLFSIGFIAIYYLNKEDKAFALGMYVAVFILGVFLIEMSSIGG